MKKYGPIILGLILLSWGCSVRVDLLGESRLQEVVRGSPVVDAQRVATIKSAVASGSYQIDDQKVADKLLRYERNLHG